MRYNDQGHIDQWRRAGEFPRIHHAMYLAVMRATTRGEHVLDLGSSIGLLGRHLADEGRIVCAAEMDAESRGRGELAGTYEGIDVFTTKIVPATARELAVFIEEHAVTTIAARRVISEIYTSLGASAGEAWGDQLRDAGVRQVVMEGRARRGDATHPCPDVEHEVAWFGRPASSSIVGEIGVVQLSSTGTGTIAG